MSGVYVAVPISRFWYLTHLRNKYPKDCTVKIDLEKWGLPSRTLFVLFKSESKHFWGALIARKRM